MDETQCKYVSSRGILKSCNITSSIPRSSIRCLRGYDFSKITEGSTIYICNSAIREFSAILPSINVKIILVSGDSDDTCHADIFKNYDDFYIFIENTKIIHWYSQNCTTIHPKLTQIPIGMDYHTLSISNNHVPHWGIPSSPTDQEQTINDVLTSNDYNPFWHRMPLCYANFHFTLDTRYGNDRVDALATIPKHFVYYEPTFCIRQQSFAKQSKYAFVISPHGGGLDCHRTWEALILGCIPIIKTSYLNKLFDDLPVLIVNEWSDINADLLHSTIELFRHKKFNYDKLLLSHWVEKITTVNVLPHS